MSDPSTSTKPPRNPWLIALVVTLATFMEVLDGTITNVALPHIAGNLGVSQNESTWVVTSYLVANAVVLPLSGWLSSTLGRKRFYMLCVALFTASSALCGLSPSLGVLILCRVLQGVGGGGLQPSEQAILVDTFPLQKRGMAMAIYAVAVLVAPVLGPTLGGWITDSFSWRWIFYINVPVGILSLTLTHFLVEDPPYLKAQVEARRSQPLQLDGVGIALIGIGLAALELVLDKGQDEDWFASRMIVVGAVTAGLALVAAVIWELRHPHPIVNLRLLADKNFTACSVVMFAFMGSFYASGVLLPQMVETLMGYSATKAGLALSPAGIATILEMPLVGFLLGRRFDPRIVLALGLGFLAAATHMMSQLTIDVGPWSIVWVRVIQCMGAGMVFVPINVLTFQSVPEKEVNNATGLFSLIRNEGSSIGVAVVTTLLVRRTEFHRVRFGEHVTASTPATYEALSQMHALGPNGLPTTAGLARLWNVVELQASQLAYLDAFFVFTLATAVVLPVVLLMKRPKPGATAVAVH